MRANRNGAGERSDKALWRRSVITESAEDKAARFLDLAGFADDRLDADDRERVEEWLARDPAAAADVVAARSHAAAAEPAPAPEAVVMRACAIIGGASRPENIVAFAARREPARLRGMAQWGSLAAAVAVAAWLGFTLGIDTSRALVLNDRPTAASAGFLNDLLETQTNLIGDPVEVPQT
jgi:anti-sigma factor RsiW